ncbi:hypothetical protein M422DRAFT_26213 [Sphaerobolus stellatus SS14]|nr:hypothetical protein M422DRAFT_26213 [Sphaerobolus stellatus SS14]
MVSYPVNHFVPSTNTPRPVLPSRHLNPNFPDILPKLPPVKFQEILREGHTIVVGRLKIATPITPGHAFILRRYDTGAISLTTMFKAAFPTAPEEFEKAESTWVRSNYDVSGANGGSGSDGAPKLRLNGTWVSLALAQHIAPEYGLEQIIKPLIAAQPDPSTEYKKSTKSGGVSHAGAVPTPSPEVATPSAPKRRRAISPATVPITEKQQLPTRTSPRKAARQSPAPRSTTPATQDVNTPGGGSDETAVEEHEEEAEVPGPDPEQDIAEQKALIADLKAKRDAAVEPKTPHNPRKRAELDTPPPTTFNPKEPEVGERDIIHRRRAIRLQPHQKAAAWGTLAFAVGLGAVSLFPSYFF